MKVSKELHELCEAVVEDRLTDTQRQRLEALVLADPEARRYYVEALHQHGSLQWSAGDPTLLPLPAAARLPRKKPWLRRLAVGAAAALLLVVTAWSVSAAVAPVATLTASKDCRWDGGSLPTEEGASLGAGRLRLAEGVARLTFRNGAEVTIEAPADLQLISAQHCVLHAGRLVAKVPPRAVGFRVDTPTALVNDLGTEFGVHVRDGATADVQVFDGVVDVQHRATGQQERLLTGRNRRFGAADANDFDPLAESPKGPDAVPRRANTRLVQISTATGKGKDAYVQPLYPSENMSDVLLLVKSTNGKNLAYNRRAYVGFDLASVGRDHTIDAQLSFTLAPTGMGFASEVPDATFAVYGLTDETLDGWDEKTLRWVNAPANLPGGVALDPSKTVKLGTFIVAQGVTSGTRSIGGTALADFLNRDTNGLVTFILVRETLGSGRADLVHGFASKNHPTLPPPTLKLSVAGR